MYHLYWPLHIRHSLLKHFSILKLLPTISVDSLQRFSPVQFLWETLFPQPHCPWPESSVSWPSHPSEVQFPHCEKHSSNKQGSTSLAAPLQISPFQRVFEFDLNNNIFNELNKSVWNSQTLCLHILLIFFSYRSCKFVNIRTILPIHQNRNMVWWSILRLNCRTYH